MSKDALFHHLQSQSFHYKLRNIEHGFTLLESLISITILSLLASLAAPSFIDTIHRTKAQSDISEFYHLLIYARTQAINTNKAIVVCGSQNGNDCEKSRDWSNLKVLVFTDNNRDGQLNNDENLLKVQQAVDNGSQLYWRSFKNKSYLTWLPQGITDYQNGNFTYCPENLDSQNAHQLILNVAGRPYWGKDSNNDGVRENRYGENLDCASLSS